MSEPVSDWATQRVRGRDWTEEANGYVTQLMDRGFNYADARTWRFLALADHGNRQIALDLPCEYRDAGFTPTEGRSWFVIYLLPPDAVEYANRGWTPIAVRRLRRLIHYVEDSTDSFGGGPGDRRPIERGWIRTRITPHYVCLYLLAGHTPATATRIEGRRLAGDLTIEPALITLAALRKPTP
jgi:hypothetical protein